MRYKKNLLAGGIWLGIACIICVVFFPTVTSFFHSDDLDLLWFVKTIRFSELWRNFPTGYFRPLISYGLWIEWHLWGTNPLGYHLSHCFLHGLNAVLIFRIGKALGFSRTCSIAAGLLFLVLPGHSETAAWIADNFGVFATLFTLLALCAFLQLRQSTSTGKRTVWGVSLIVFGALGLLSKEAALFLPVFVVIFNCMRPVDNSKKVSGYVLALFLLLPLYFLVRWFYLGSFFGGPGGNLHISAGLFAWGMLRALPATLCPMTTSVPAFALAAVILLPLIAWQIRRIDALLRRDVLCLLLAFYVAVLPGVWTSLSPPLWGYDTRILYLPSAFACLALVRLAEPLRFALPGAAALLTLFSVQSFLIFGQWHLAGEWVRDGLSTMASFPPCRRRIVLVSPDIRYPAYVFRRGLDSGQRLLTSNPPHKTETLALVVFYGDRDQVELKRDGDSRELTATLHYGIPVIKKTPAIDPNSGIAIPLQTVTPPRFHILLPDSQTGDQLVYFSEGHFHLWSQ